MIILLTEKMYFFQEKNKLIEKVCGGEVEEKCWLFNTADKDI